MDKPFGKLIKQDIDIGHKEQKLGERGKEVNVVEESWYYICAWSVLFNNEKITLSVYFVNDALE